MLKISLNSLYKLFISLLKLGIKKEKKTQKEKKKEKLQENQKNQKKEVVVKLLNQKEEARLDMDSGLVLHGEQ